MTERVSIIIPTYNKAAYLGEAINSALQQTHPNIEVVVMDDGSTDSTAELIAAHAEEWENVRFLHQANQGVCHARNNAIAQSTGEYIVPLDADDVLLPTFVERCIERFRQHPDTTLVYTACQYIGQRTGVLGGDYSYDHLLFYSQLPATALYRRTDFDRTPGYNPNMQYALEDWDFYLSLLNRGSRVEYIDECLMQYRITPHSRNANIERYQEAIFRQVYNNHRHLYEPYNDLLLLANDRWHEYERLYRGIYNSKAYRIGKIILHPAKYIQKHITRHAK